MAASDVLVRLRMLGASQMQREAARGASGLRQLERSAATTRTRFQGLEAGMDRVGGGLATFAGLAARAGSVGAVALGAGLAYGAKTGINFNATMESNTIAFRQFLGSTSAAQSHLEGLYKTASTTPFEFPDLVAGSRRLLAFGQTAGESNKWLSTIGDTVAGIGGGTEEINRMVAAVGQIQAKGKVSTEELLQLAELGIPAFDAIAKGTGRSMDQVFSDLQAGEITAEEGLGALQRQLGRTFGGASAAQAKTFNGQLSTLKDNARALAGEATKPLFGWLRSEALPSLNDFVDRAQTFVKGGGLKQMGTNMKSAFEAGQEGTKASSSASPMTKVASLAGQAWAKAVPMIKSAAASVLDAFKPAMPFLQNVLLPLFTGVAKGVIAAVIGIVPVIKLFAQVLGFIGRAAAPLKPVIEGIGMVIGFVLGGPILKALAIIPKLGVVFRLLSVPLRVVGVVLGGVGRFLGMVFRGAVKIGPAIASAFGKGIGLVRRFLGFMAGLAGKVGQIAVSLVSRYLRAWGTIIGGVRKIVGRIAGVVRGVGSGILNAGKALGNKIISGIETILKTGPGKIKTAILNLLPGPLRTALSSVGGALGELFATGGTVRSPLQVVGERGPELARLPQGTHITPASRTRSMLANAAAGGVRQLEGGGTVPIALNVYLSGEQIHREVFRVERRQLERR